MSKETKKLRIAHFGNRKIFERSGGVEVVVAEIASRQAALGHDVTVYNRRGHHISGAEFDMDNIKEWEGVHMKYVPTIPKAGLAAVSSSFFAALCCAVGQYDVVHIHAEGPSAFCWIPKLFGKRIICHNHGLDWKRSKWQGGPGAKFIKFGEKMSAKYADELIVLSPEIQRYFRETYNKETHLIPNGVNRPVKREPDLITRKYGVNGQDYILYLSRITEEKRADLLIKAYQKLNTQMKLMIAGGASESGGFLEKMKELASKDPKIIFTGFVKGRLLEELYSNAYLYILPSDIEGMPLSLLEAMSYGNCCLVSDIAECENVIGGHGVTFSKGSEEALKECLGYLIDNPETVKKLQASSPDYICGKYSWDDAAAQMLCLYNP